MRTLKHLFFSTVVVLLLSAAPYAAFGQNQQPAMGKNQQSNQPAENQKSWSQNQSQKTVQGLKMEGTLKSADTSNKTFLIMANPSKNNQQMNSSSAQNQGMKEYLFHYNDQTKVIGQSSGVQGLTGETGTRIRVDYKAVGNKAIAEKIEILNQGSSRQQSSQGQQGAQGQ